MTKVRQLTPNQIKVLQEIYSSEDDVVEYDNRQKRTIEVLTRKGLITYKYADPTPGGQKRVRYFDVIQCKRKASERKVEAEIAKAIASRRKS